ncbi:MAG: sialate O-acetylesterase [Pirellulales bacterium]
MNSQRFLSITIYSVVVIVLAITLTSNGMAESPDPWGKPVKVYILSGQSNMVGIGQVSGGGTRWSGITDTSVSVYPGKYSPDVNYDKLTPIKTQPLPVYGGVTPTPFPGGGVQVARGLMEIKTSGVYRFKPGYSNSTFNIMELDGVEVFRKEVGKDLAYTSFKIIGGKKYAFKITFLTDAANGLGWWERTDIPGTLDTVVNADGKFPHLIDDQGNWKERNDVWYKGLVTAGANKWLSIGCGASSNSIGPELQFGHIMGDHHNEPVIILKSSQGNRSLSWDFLPPGSKGFTQDGRTYAGYKESPNSWIEGEPKKEVNWYAGKQYDDCFGEVHRVLENFDTEFPQFEGQGYEVAGFVWWQGHKDGGSDVHANRYEQNLVHLIKTLRKEFKAQQAPFVIATIGFDGWKMSGNQLTIAKAQLAVSGENKKYPEFTGNVLTVETRDFWKEVELSPRNQGFHYNGNAETYMMVGDAMGRGMLKLLRGKN